jgi:hypothetical protein
MSLQQKAYVHISKKQKLFVPDCIKFEIKNKAVSKIQKWYRTHLQFLNSCKNLDKNFTKGFLVKSIFYGLHLDGHDKYHELGPYNYAYELRLMVHKLSKHILFNNNPVLNITPEQVKTILTVFTKDQLLHIGFGLDPARLTSRI